MKGIGSEAKAKVYHDRYESASPEEREQLRKELGIVLAAGDVLGDTFFEELAKLKASTRNQTVK